MASPSPPPTPRSPSPVLGYFRNRCGRRSGAIPRPSSATETATCMSSRAAEIRIGAVSGECRAALASRLFSTCTMRPRSVITRGRSAGRSMSTVCPLSPERNAVRACSTSSPSSEGSGATERVPASIRPASSRSPISTLMRSACSSMMRKNCRVSAGPKLCAGPSTVVVEPLMAASGVRSSWLTIPRKSTRIRSSASSGARSCAVATNDRTVPSSAWIGVALSSTRMLPPPGVETTISSARSVSARFIVSTSGKRSSSISRPSAKRQVATSSTRSRGWPGMRRTSNMRLASRLNDAGRPVRASNTTTPTGEVSTTVSRSARARCSARKVRALTMAAAACAANSSSTSSSSSVNSAPPSLSPRKKLPTWAPRWRIGVLMQARRQHDVPGHAQRTHEGGEVGDPERPRQVAELLEELHAAGPLRHPAVVVLGQARGDEFPGRSRLVDGDDAAVARAGELAGAVGHFLQDGLQVEAGADAQQCLAQGGQT